MARPQGGRYILNDGSVVPSVTTVLGKFKDPGALMYWAAKQSADYIQRGCEGLDIISMADVGMLCVEAPKKFRQVAEEAADIGTQVHHAIEAMIKGNAYELTGTEEQKAKANSAISAYQAWAKGNNLEFLWTERALVSEKHKFGGTPDALGTINGSVVLPDWKSSNSLYPDYLCQLAAYKELIEECEPEHKIVGGMYLCRFSKENGDFAVHHFPDLSEAWEMFLMLRKCYEINKVLAKRVG